MAIERGYWKWKLFIPVIVLESSIKVYMVLECYPKVPWGWKCSLFQSFALKLLKLSSLQWLWPCLHPALKIPHVLCSGILHYGCFRIDSMLSPGIKPEVSSNRKEKLPKEFTENLHRIFIFHCRQIWRITSSFMQNFSVVHIDCIDFKLCNVGKLQMSLLWRAGSRLIKLFCHWLCGCWGGLYILCHIICIVTVLNKWRREKENEQCVDASSCVVVTTWTFYLIILGWRWSKS